MYPYQSPYGPGMAQSEGMGNMLGLYLQRFGGIAPQMGGGLPPQAMQNALTGGGLPPMQGITPQTGGGNPAYPMQAQTGSGYPAQQFGHNRLSGGYGAFQPQGSYLR